MKSKLVEIKLQANELPEIRKHVLLLLNFIQNIKSGLKNVSTKETDFMSTKRYKEEISTLICQISNVTKGFNLSELIAKSDFGKGLFSSTSKSFKLTDYITKNEFGKGFLSSTIKNRRLTELISNIDSKIGSFSFISN